MFGCPVVCKKWTSEGGKDNEQTERGMRGIFIGFTSHQKGFLVYTPGSYQIMISGYLIFDESFSTAIVATWQQRHDSLALWPLHGMVSDPDTVLELTGTLEVIACSIKEGNHAPPDDHASLDHLSITSSTSE